ncbi:SPFH domain-containing protein [Niveispirillum sp. KHB5.9]|uniref:SPFH domain-containing protein n=1 Tax=Niveispirillum sp. KHB5.9 TaxID=3400269 RepID=UPI003A85DC0A
MQKPQQIGDRAVTPRSGLAMLGIGFIIAILGIALTIMSFKAGNGIVSLLWVLLVPVGLFAMLGLFIVQPNQAVALTLFGDYRGTVTAPGLRWVNPFYSKHRVSLRVHNFETGTLKVNDADGSPIEIGAIIVWQVTDAAEALFNVEDYKGYVAIQAESALRLIATSYPYDDHGGEVISLRGNGEEISNHLQVAVQERLAQAGIRVIEARISHLAYAPEIAGAMLQRQQANAVVAARAKIVEGAVGMVEMALDQLAARAVVHLDDERKAHMVSNLLVVLCADRATQPVVNTGSLY